MTINLAPVIVYVRYALYAAAKNNRKINCNSNNQVLPKTKFETV